MLCYPYTSYFIRCYAIGLGAMTGYLDYALIPVLAVFLGLTFYAYSKYEKSHKNKEM
ncbi:mercury resistance system transport protein MerF [Rossellomorea aquimaris]|uniref:mercury resistance system transport protein MerF n=1 Tax=Rossellomorea aquimaris TaxID=189382 RepID=UPI002852E7A5|nr:mercury resistance system transport protein MerF [Rossellomorea aquimaris]